MVMYEYYPKMADFVSLSDYFPERLFSNTSVLSVVCLRHMNLGVTQFRILNTYSIENKGCVHGNECV
jgi:hypothetical protein